MANGNTVLVEDSGVGRFSVIVRRKDGVTLTSGEAFDQNSILKITRPWGEMADSRFWRQFKNTGGTTMSKVDNAALPTKANPRTFSSKSAAENELNIYKMDGHDAVMTEYTQQGTAMRWVVYIKNSAEMVRNGTYNPNGKHYEAPSNLKSHKQYTSKDYDYLRQKGYSDSEVKALWDRDAKDGAEPAHWNNKAFANGCSKAEAAIADKLKMSNRSKIANSNDCKSFRRDTEQCNSGCDKAKPPVRAGDSCRFVDRQAADCPCYK